MDGHPSKQFSREVRERGKGTGRYVPVLVFLLMAGVFLATLFSLYPAMPIIERLPENIPGFDVIYPPFRVDENVYYAIAQNILRGKVYRPDSLERFYPIGFPLIAAPFVALGGKAGGFAANAVIMAFTAVLFFLLLRRYASLWKALALTLILSFATVNWFYAVSFYSEPLSQLLVLLSFYWITEKQASRWFRLKLAASGLVCGLTLFVRPHAALLVLPFFAYLAFGEMKKPTFNRRSLWFAGGIASVVVLWVIRNAAVFGSPLSFEYSRLAGSFAPFGESGYMKGNVFLGMHMLLFDQYHGLFTITPIFLLFPAGLRSMWLVGLRRESVILLAASVLIALFAASGPYPFTEFGLGSRHMMPVLPLLLFPAVFFLNGKLFSRSVVTVLALYSFYHAGIGWFTGGEPGMGFFLGILNEAQSRAIILARKDMLPKREFRSREELLATYRNALKRADMMRFLQTLNPEVIRNIRGNERAFMLHLRNQPDPAAFIERADTETGIVMKDFSFSTEKKE